MHSFLLLSATHCYCDLMVWPGSPSLNLGLRHFFFFFFFLPVFRWDGAIETLDDLTNSSRQLFQYILHL